MARTKGVRLLITGVFLIFVAGSVLLFVRMHDGAADACVGVAIEVDGTRRCYRLVVPDGLGDAPVPLVFAYHGASATPESLAEISRFDQLADEKRFIVVYPKSLHRSWNTLAPGKTSSDENSDIRFFDVLFEKLTTQYKVDSHRVAIVGISNGASFALLVADQRSEKIAAVVAHSGYRPPGAEPPEHLFPILFIVGNEDSPALADGMRNVVDRYREIGRDVELIMVDGLGHSWATGENERIWDFLFER
ncbi:MAG: dienelactone hydrolase family protein [Chloroflexi bacterium]|nr:dienelactone hydrolase family protein [Chloroflexota bacterium]